MSYSFIHSVQLLPTQTSETLTCKPRPASTGILGSSLGTGTHRGSGEYQFNVTLADDFAGWLEYYNGSNTYQTCLPVNVQTLNTTALETQLDAIQAKTDLITNATEITVTSPITAAGTISVIQGDTYSSAIARDIQLSSDDWPDLTGATVKFAAKNKQTGILDLENVTVGVDDAGTATQTLVLQLTAANTNALTVGDELYLYDFQATLAGGAIVTLARGTLTVVADINE